LKIDRLVPLTTALYRKGGGRRACLLGVMGAVVGGFLPASAQAGAQQEEPLADAVRTALAAAIANSAPPRPAFASTEARLAYLRWLGEMSTRLKKRTTDHTTRVEFLETVWYESKRAGLEPNLVLGLVQVESGFRKYAISSVGARGYMQVMPFWARLIGGAMRSRSSTCRPICDSAA